MSDFLQGDQFYSIAVDAPLWPDIWTYRSSNHLEPGDIVEVPFGKRNSFGVVTAYSEKKIENPFEIKSIHQKIDLWKKLTPSELKLYQWTAKYYQYPLGKLIFDSLPNPTKKIQKIQNKNKPLKEWHFHHSSAMISILEKLEEQSHGGFSQHLLHGVTGSGKSLIYLQWIKKIIARQKSVLYLVPEINLTPQFVQFFSDYIEAPIVQFHSQISAGQRFAIYHHLKQAVEPVLIISARSGIFLPVENLGALIIDEEHDQSYKQDDRCKYHARDVAIYKAKIQDVPILMGSATPSTESYRRFVENSDLQKNYYQLKERYHQQEHAAIEKITEPHYTDSSWPLSPQLIEDIKKTLATDKSQVLIFVNKLGFARYIQCKSCHRDFSCPNCSVKLTYFKKRQSIECHLCEYKAPLPQSCPECGCLTLFSQGFGVEKVVEKLSEHFAASYILRIDRDEAKSVHAAQERFDAFNKGEFKILVGTQMITKGHNFKNIKLVIVLGIDAQLHTAEFRAKERIYQILNQVAGRAGREGDSSRVLIQTNLAEEELRDLLSHDMDKFYQEELKIRKMVHYPPYRKIVQLVLRGQNEENIHHELQKIKTRLEKTIQEHNLAVDIKGPKPASLEKVKNQWGETLILLSEKAELFYPLLKQLHLETKLLKKMQLSINVDPQYVE